MNIAGLRSIGSAVLLVLLAEGGCNRPKRAPAESSATPTTHAVRASIAAHAPDAFYDPPAADARAERLLEELHAPADEHDQFFYRAAAGAGAGRSNRVPESLAG